MRSAFSNSVTACPARANCWAQARPAGPEPTTATFLPVRRGGITGSIQPSSQPRSTIAHSMVLIVTGLSSMLSVHAASQGAGQIRPVNSGKIVGRMQGFERCSPLVAIDEVIPIRDQIVDRAAVMTERNAAIHATRRLHTRLGCGQGFDKLVPIAPANVGFIIRPVLALDLKKPGWSAHPPLGKKPCHRRPGQQYCHKFG